MYGLRWSVYLLLFVSTCVRAHEFWIEPTRFEVSESERIVADLRVGQYFKGNSQVLAPYKFESLNVIDSRGSRPVNGRLGDLPAVKVAPRTTGLHILAYRSKPTSVVYSSYEEFASFVRKQGLDSLAGEHRRRGLPETDIKEVFSRYAKSLLRVGSATGSDRTLGMPLELVAETNPYAGDETGPVMVRLLRDGQAYADAQISIFRKQRGCEASRTTVRTDARGRAAIPRAGGGRFLVNAVHVAEPSAQTRANYQDALWESMWASLTYALPQGESQGENQGEANGDDCKPAGAF